ncbi:hypothetical protein KIKIMORA_03120 [Brevundimonas phage vB_BpoS-Kikimora]|uniref:Uncharacterized protein n=2 Tax=Kikimoravirus TaxID=3425051 RepID=A0A9E7N1W7_9CAUD|nr:hypothetical protein KIKIMORA_03120 [Brevundimonas phage vB_BpoS-Kikimora]UTC28344.1 hypothetical protein GURKE_03170 [Brevundimonas phage vB_BpoS-Gurke]
MVSTYSTPPRRRLALLAILMGAGLLLMQCGGGAPVTAPAYLEAF